MSDIQQIIRELSEALAKSTPGEWKSSPASIVVGSLVHIAPNNNVLAAIPRGGTSETEANAKLACLAHNHLPALLAYITALEQRAMEASNEFI